MKNVSKANIAPPQQSGSTHTENIQSVNSEDWKNKVPVSLLTEKLLLIQDEKQKYEDRLAGQNGWDDTE